MAAEQPASAAVGFCAYVPEPCVLHPERGTEYPYIELLTGELGGAVEEREDAQEEAAYEAGEAAEEGGEEAWLPTYRSDLSLAPGWKAGGHPAWYLTGPGTMDCDACACPMELLLTVAANEWHADTRSWIPLEDGPQHPTGVVVGNHGKLNLFACPGTRPTRTASASSSGQGQVRARSPSPPGPSPVPRRSSPERRRSRR